MAFEDVETGSGLEIEHHDRSFRRSHRETLGVHMEIDGWKAVRGNRQPPGLNGRVCLVRQELTFGRRA